MSAFHWEARRRQAVLERRRAAILRATGSSRMDCGHGTDSSATQASPPEPQPSRCCCCPCHRASNTSAKLPKRFSDIEYMQQW